MEGVVGLEGFSDGDEFVHDNLDAGRVAREIAGQHPVPVQAFVARRTSSDGQVGRSTSSHLPSPG